MLSSFASTGTVARVLVRTRAKGNPNPSIWYRVPCDYRKVPGRRWRTLVIFGGRNCGGEAEVSGKLGWLPWADRYGIFLVAPGFKDDRYWEPQAWSGKALLSALAEIRKSYDIDTDHLLYYGYSAGVLRSPAKRGENALIFGFRKRLFESHCATDESGKVR